MNNANGDDPDLKHVSTSVAVSAAVAAYFFSPILPYAHASFVAMLGGVMAFGAAGVWLATKYGGWVWMSIAGVMLMASLAGIAWQISQAEDNYIFNDMRCLHIQQEMLKPVPRRADGPELFQALNCRPQGNADVQFPAPPKDKETTAPLPAHAPAQSLPKH